MENNKSCDIKWLNSLPVNFKAREMLIAAGQKPDPACMHSVQLAKWGVDQGVIEVEGSLLETVEAMLTWRPARLANFFVISADGQHNSDGWADAVTPVEMATVLLNEIESKMMLHFPWYSDFEI